jgi:hypothetical protein
MASSVTAYKQDGGLMDECMDPLATHQYLRDQWGITVTSTAAFIPPQLIPPKLIPPKLIQPAPTYQMGFVEDTIIPPQLSQPAPTYQMGFVEDTVIPPQLSQPAPTYQMGFVEDTVIPPQLRQPAPTYQMGFVEDTIIPPPLSQPAPTYQMGLVEEPIVPDLPSEGAAIQGGMANLNVFDGSMPFPNVLDTGMSSDFAFEQAQFQTQDQGQSQSQSHSHVQNQSCLQSQSSWGYDPPQAQQFTTAVQGPDIMLGVQQLTDKLARTAICLGNGPRFMKAYVDDSVRSLMSELSNDVHYTYGMTNLVF